MTASRELLGYALDIGEQMLVSGAEVSRVEDSISRICKAYNAERVDVFTITSAIVVTLQMEEKVFTQTRRIHKYSTDLDKLDRLNNLSRYICIYMPDMSYIREELKRISKGKIYKPYIQYLAYALIAGSFTIFFGGSLADAAVSSAIGILLKLLITVVQKADKNLVFINIVCSFTAGMLAVLSVSLGIGMSLGKIVIGNIMLLIPGVAFTNSIRDIFSGDTIAGLLRLCEAIVIALSISVGFVAAFVFFGGILK